MMVSFVLKQKCAIGTNISTIGFIASGPLTRKSTHAVLYLMPGGKDMQLFVLQKCLKYIQRTNPTPGQYAAWFFKAFRKGGGYTRKKDILKLNRNTMIDHFSLVKESLDGRFELTKPGQKYLQSRSKSFPADIILKRRGGAQLMDVLSDGPLTRVQIHERLMSRLHPNWSEQYTYNRLVWLSAVGKINIDGGRYFTNKSSTRFQFDKSDFQAFRTLEGVRTLRNERLMDLCNLITEKLTADKHLSSFVIARDKIYRVLLTWSPYMPNHNQRDGTQKRVLWIGLAQKSSDIKKQWDTIQFQYGISERGSSFFGLWLEKNSVVRDVAKILEREDDPKSNYDGLMRFKGKGYHISARDSRKDGDIISTSIDELKLQEYVAFEKQLCYAKHLHLGKKFSRRELISLGPNVLKNIIETTKELMPLYNWWTDSERNNPLGQKKVSDKNSPIPSEIATSMVKTLAMMRKGQGKIRKDALRRYENECALCEIKESRMLVASHIIPWADDTKGRGRPENVLCLCIAHDWLFENRLIGISDNLSVIFSNELRGLASKVDMIRAWKRNTQKIMKEPTDGTPTHAYLSKHRKEIRS
jgi:predicted restriction endonuclease